MLDMIILFIVGVFTGGAVAGEVCAGSLSYSIWTAYTVYCEHGCCGTYYDRECCSSLTGLIIGAVFGGLCFVGGIVFLICICHHCNKKKTTVGAVTTIGQQRGNVAIIQSSSVQQGVPQPGVYQQPGVYPPPNPNQPGMYPPPGPNQPGVYGQPNAPPPAYPPPIAGQSNVPPPAYPPPTGDQFNTSAPYQPLSEKH